MKENRKKQIWPFAVLIVVTVLALVLAAVLLLGNNPDADWQEQYDLGRRYLEEGNYEEAILAFSAAIEIDPKRPEAYLGRGEAYMELGDYESAMKDFEKAQRRDPDNEEIEEKIEELDQRIEEQQQSRESMKKLTYMKYDMGYIEEWYFSYNEMGLMTEATCYGYYEGDENPLPDNWTFIYNENGQILKAERTTTYGVYYSEEYLYNSSNLLIERKIRDGEYNYADTEYSEYYEYDENQNLVKRGPTPYGDTIEYVYDEQGRMIQSMTYTGYGEYIETSYICDSEGNMAESTSLLHSENKYRHYTYDYSYPLLVFKNWSYGDGWMSSYLTVSDIPTDTIPYQYVGFMPQMPENKIYKTEDGYLKEVYGEDDGYEFLIWEFRYEDISERSETALNAPGASDGYLHSIPLGTTSWYDLNGDGVDETIRAEILNGIGYLTVNGVTEIYRDFTENTTGYYTIININGDGSELLVGVSDWGPSEDHSTELFAYDGSRIINVGWFDAILGKTTYGEGGARVLGDGTIEAYTRRDVLGTWSADALYRYEDHILWNITEFYQYCGYGEGTSWPVTTKCDITMYKEAGNYDNHVVIPAGTDVRMTGCVEDGATMYWVAFESDAFNGTLWAFVTTDGWPEKVHTPQGSVSTDEAFEGFYFAD